LTEITFRYLSGHDVAALALTNDEILHAIEASLRAQGDGETVIEPRMHLVPNAAFGGHFNVLRGYIAAGNTAGVKIVGDYHENYNQTLPYA
jgi:alanine dehydrogenase